MLKSLWVILLLSTGTIVMAEEQARTVTVTGTGFAEVAPDRATLQMSIAARKKTLDLAQQTAADVTKKVLQMTERLGIDRDRVDTTGALVRPNYRWNRDREEQELIGYIAERQIRIEIEDLEQLGAVIEGAVSAGVNQVSPPQLDSSERKETHRRALRAAAADAKAKARELAKALDARLGPVISINAGADVPRPPVPYATGMRAMGAEADAAETYNPAELRFDATVTAVFELTD